MTGTTTSCPTFPVELSEIIIDHLFDASKALAACSLVCSAWTARTRHLLFGTIDIDLNFPWRAKVLLGLLTHSNSTISGHVHSLKLGCGSDLMQDCGSPQNEEPMRLDAFLSAFTYLVEPSTVLGITRLHLSNVDFTAYPLGIQRRITTALSRFSNVARLSLDNTVLHDVRQLNVSVLHVFPALQALEAGVKFLKYADQSTTRMSTHEARSVLNGLQELEIHEAGMATLLAWIAADAPQMELPRKLSISKCTQEIIPGLSAALRAFSSSLKEMKISFLQTKQSDESSYPDTASFSLSDGPSFTALQTLHVDDIDLSPQIFPDGQSLGPVMEFMNGITCPALEIFSLSLRLTGDVDQEGSYVATEQQWFALCDILLDTRRFPALSRLEIWLALRTGMDCSVAKSWRYLRGMKECVNSKLCGDESSSLDKGIEKKVSDRIAVTFRIPERCKTTPLVRRQRRTKAEILAAKSSEVSSPPSNTESSAPISPNLAGTLSREQPVALIVSVRNSGTNILGEPLPAPPSSELPVEVLQELFETFRISHYNIHPLMSASDLTEKLRLNSWNTHFLSSQDRVLAHCIIAVATLLSTNPFVLRQGELNTGDFECFLHNAAPLKVPLVPDLRPYGIRREYLLRRLWAEAIWLANQEGITTNPSRENATSCWLLGHLSFMICGNGVSPHLSAYVYHVRFLAESGRLGDFNVISHHGHMMVDAMGALFSKKSIPFTLNEERLTTPVRPPGTLEQLICSIPQKAWSVSDVFLSIHASFAQTQPLNEPFLIKHFASLDLFRSFLSVEMEQVSTALQQLEPRSRTNPTPQVHSRSRSQLHYALPPSYHLRSIRQGFIAAWGSLVLAMYELLRDRVQAQSTFVAEAGSNTSHMNNVSDNISDSGSASAFVNPATAARDRDRLLMHYRHARNMAVGAAVEVGEALRDAPSAARLGHREMLARWAGLLMDMEVGTGIDEGGVYSYSSTIPRTQCFRALESFRDAIQLVGFSYADRTGIVEKINEYLASSFVDELWTHMVQVQSTAHVVEPWYSGAAI
ncbi:hypothetical protein D9757_005003 [Collybiopsis confluens]|uniref:Uncharacterized protein n=1 Tax=Collybiopsis confluens TaxID=2823264 RepID=A0A8H5MC72_9AGAR|nr:hypothetical protein D9757_005003 [Collybiopsis confluens]